MRKRNWMMGLVLAAAAFVASTCVEVAPILSNSMAPMLSAGKDGRDLVVVERVTHRVRAPHRWEVVTLADPRDPSRTLIKRVVGLPGETVVIRDSGIEVNGAMVQRPEGGIAPRYLASGRSRWVIPRGAMVVLGDNSGSSLDSRAFGVVPVDSVRGHLLGKLGRL